MSRAYLKISALAFITLSFPLITIVYKWWQSTRGSRKKPDGSEIAEICDEKPLKDSFEDSFEIGNDFEAEKENRKVVDMGEIFSCIESKPLHQAPAGRSNSKDIPQEERNLKPSTGTSVQKSEDENLVLKSTASTVCTGIPQGEKDLKPSTINSVQKSEDKNLDPKSTTSTAYIDFPFLVHPKTTAVINGQASKVMFIMRGLSGSGKSTIVQAMQSSFQQVSVCSADHFFNQEDGSYAFDASKLSQAHGECQRKAKEACEKGMSVVIIDNTNVKRWEMKSYLGTAKDSGYIVVLVEPKTPWKLDAMELVNRNKHGVPLDVLQKKVKVFEDVIPLYYGWFLNKSSSNQLQGIGDRHFQECLELFPEFKEELLQQAEPYCHNIEEEEADEILSKYYSQGSKASSLLHCTSHYCNHGRVADAKEYHRKKEVQQAYGQNFSLTITGLTLTRKTLGARLTLDAQCTSLFKRPEEEEWKSMENDSAFGGVIKVKEKKMKKSSKSKNKKNLKLVMADSGESRRSGSASGNHSQAQDGDQISRDSDTSGNDSVCLSLNDLFPELHNSGKARSAHITLKTAKQIQSKETNFDVLHVCDIEHSTDVGQTKFYPVQLGQACYYGDGICCVYFDKPLVIDALFSGYY